MGIVGGNATSVSRGEALGDSLVSVADNARGGGGGYLADGGKASSTVIASGAGASDVFALSRAIGGAAAGDGIHVPMSGSASALAAAAGLGGVDANALVTQQTFGQAQNGLRDASAAATGWGPLSRVDAHASAATGADGYLNAISHPSTGKLASLPHGAEP
jgi:hypothetical protein